MAANQTAGRPYNRRSATEVDIFRNLFTDFVDTRNTALFYDEVTYDTILDNGRRSDGTGAGVRGGQYRYPRRAQGLGNDG
jgi:hypothetical protein